VTQWIACKYCLTQVINKSTVRMGRTAVEQGGAFLSTSVVPRYVATFAGRQ
jgi:hypothetical protein